jgi:nitrite reductase/ring-hydroxylating ferredoxin subunit/uncharacterized membrane protein
MKRDLTERLEQIINGSHLLVSFAEWLRRIFDAIFLNGPLRPLKNFLNGKWLEHPLHPVLTDVPIGAWLIAIVLDLAALIFGVPNLGGASGIAIAIGLLGALGAIATGFMDWQDVDPRELTVGITHALINAIGTLLFAISFFWRWTDNWQIDAGKTALIVIGYLVLTAGAFLGGTLVFRMGVMVNRNAHTSGPDDFVSVLPMQDLRENQPIRVEAEGVPVLLVLRNEEVYAIGAVCSHYGGPLEQGKLVNGRIECPWHYSQFALKDGRAMKGPTTSPVPQYETRISRGQIQVRLKKTDR